MTTCLPPTAAQADVRPLNRQAGLSLIELMVGLTIGLLVVLAATGSLLVTRQGTTTVSDSYRLTTAGNNAMRLIASSIRQAGAIELVQTAPGEKVIFAPLVQRGATLAGDQLVFGTEGGAGTDTLTVSYEHRNANVTRDCLGNDPGVVPERIDNLFSVNNVELRCVGNLGLAGTVIGGGAQALVGDDTNANGEVAVEDFQVWYWVQNPADPTQSQRVTAAAIAAGNWGNVQTVEVCLQLRGINANYPAVGTYRNCRDTDVANNGRLRQVFRGMYKLRNRM
jgi:type IV pilus assembly protein PilW